MIYVPDLRAEPAVLHGRTFFINRALLQATHWRVSRRTDVM